MANRLIRFISETQVRLGWVDTTSERLLYQTAREIKSVVKTPKRLLSSLLIVLTIARPAFADPITLLAQAVDLLAKNTNAIKGVVEEGKKLQEGVNGLTEKGFVNSLVNSYKQIKLTQASIESIATSSLRDTIDYAGTRINMTSATDLSEKDVLGITHESGEYKPLRLRSRKFSDTNFSDAKVFSDELDKVVDEFDAMQVIRYQAQAGDKVGTAILNGKVKDVDEAVDEQWKEFLNDEEGDNKFKDFIEKTKVKLNTQESEELAILAESAHDISDEDKGIMSKLLATKHAISQRALDLGAKEILNAKKNNEINKSGVTYMRESAKIKAQIQSIINDVQKRVYEIIKLNRQDNSTEEDLKLYVDGVTKALDGSTAKPYGKSPLVKKMKLRPAADAEINRLLAMANFAIKQQHLQLVDLQEKDRHIKAMDDAGKANFDRQKSFERSFDASDKDLVSAAAVSRQAMATYKENSVPKKIKPTNKKIDIKTRVTNANAIYFANAKKDISLTLLMKLFDAYIKAFKNFFQGAAFEKVMEDTADKADLDKENRDRETLTMYDRCVDGLLVDELLVDELPVQPNV